MFPYFNRLKSDIVNLAREFKRAEKQLECLNQKLADTEKTSNTALSSLHNTLKEANISTECKECVQIRYRKMDQNEVTTKQQVTTETNMFSKLPKLLQKE